MRLTLSIEEGEEVFISKKHQKINDLCAIIYDQLTEIYIEKNYKNLLKTEIITKEHQKFIDELNAGDIHALDYLKANNLDHEIELIISKHIFLAVTSDLINFLFESLHCAKRGKMTVAYSLLRKPFLDELFILEQLLVDRTDFVKRFFHDGNPEKYDPSNPKIDKKEIIEKAISKIRFNYFYDVDLIYDLRYNKSFESGINSSTNQALHIVTKDKNYKTAEQNLNFVFSIKEDMNKYFANYYFVVPNLLFYTVSVIDEIAFNFLQDDKNKQVKVIKEFRRIIAYLFFTEFANISSKKKNEKILKHFYNHLMFKCPVCKHNNQIERADLELFYQIENFICTKCFNTLIHDKKSVNVIQSLLDTF
ncbi:hypothetical protein [Flavobacterium sp.]|uniref:hypothetical protein n=1 Tax=Flavobacterium sp. TaxID=239 RepID=UPI0031E2CCC3